MIGIITGDIINSRKTGNPDVWIVPLTRAFNTIGSSPKKWEFYRGDSFQLEVSHPENTMYEALKIKAIVKSVAKHLDVRLGIGIGDKSYEAEKITMANGGAFINSGEAFERIRKTKKNIEITTPWIDLDVPLSIMVELALLVMDKWTIVTAEVVKTCLENPDKKQSEIAELLGIKSQPEISQARRRGAFDEIMKIEKYFREYVITHR